MLAARLKLVWLFYDGSCVGDSIKHRMNESPIKTAGTALMGWWRATTLDALIVGAIWFAGLELIGVAFAPLWATFGALLQFIPTYGGMIALIGPVLAVAFSGHDEWRLGLVLGLYGLIAVLEGLVIGPYVLHRTTRVPWWAALFGPIVLGIVIPFWGVLIAPPLMAVVFAFVRPSAGERR
jgi:predicted PurR-regulated permease PerM